MTKPTPVMMYPVPGRLILQPDMAFKPFPDEGRLVFLNSFYGRTLAQGDLSLKPSASAAAPAVATVTSQPVTHAAVAPSSAAVAAALTPAK